MTQVEVALERETANDETALVVAVHVRSGETVQKDDVLFDVENSKATQEMVAPVSGVLMHRLTVGDTVGFGVGLAWITPMAEASAPAAILPTPPEIVAPTPEPHRRAAPVMEADDQSRAGGPFLSRAAVALCDQFGLDRSRFSQDFVTAADVQALVKGPPDPVAPVEAGIAELARPLGDGAPVAGRKRAEINALSGGAGQTMLSVIGALVGPLHVARDPGHFLTGRITDLVIYEASRLLRAYPNLNAAYADGRIVQRGAIHAGMAIDGGGRLVVYGIEHSDQVDLPDLSAIMADAVARYVENTLTGSELGRASFTVTDLSETGLDFVFPLLPAGQSCIIGVTRSEPQGYRLFVGFDHRVTEGREAALFLGELTERLRSFDGAGATRRQEAVCTFCERSAAEAVSVNKDRGLMKIIGRDGRDALCCASCWNGW